MMPNYYEVCDSVNGANFKFITLQLQDGYKVVVTNIGQRILGPFNSKNESEFLWINNVMNNTEMLKSYQKDGQWNIGGDRLWVAPEVQYNCSDRKRFWETLFISKDIEPGNFNLKETENSILLKGEMQLEAFNLASNLQKLTIETKITICDRPKILKNFDVNFCGYSINAVMSIKGKSSAYSSIWNLAQILPQGRLFIEVNQKPSIVDYFNNAQNINIEFNKHYSILPITGRKMYKLGFKAKEVTGTMIYFNQNPDNCSIVIKNYSNNPDGFYPDEPPNQLSENGCSIYVYNNDGISGEFAEMECFSPVCGSKLGLEMTKLEVDTMFIKGDLIELQRVLDSLVN